MNERQWIWVDVPEQCDNYGEFYEEFQYEKGDAVLHISADSNYAVYVNGVFADSGQYPDFPHYKVYDELDITRYCVGERNHLAIIVWYYGKENMSYFPGKAALQYELLIQNKTVCVSSEQTMSRLSRAYNNGYQKEITSQIGFSFMYDCAAEDEWKTGVLKGFSKSRCVYQQLPTYLRPIKKCIVNEPVNTKLLKNGNNTYFLYDLGQETCGYLTFSLFSQVKQQIVFRYGEHIEDGGVRYLIDERDFTMEVIVGEGNTTYTNPFRRIGLRYMEVVSESPIHVEYATVCPVEYPLRKVKWEPQQTLEKKIYNTAVRTLELCMHDHYEDTPWREQALYVLDSRNQMLSGYYAFQEYEFARANLLLISKDKRADDFLSICFPSVGELTIPSFSLHYFTAVYEYAIHSKDLSLVQEVYPKLQSLLAKFVGMLEGDCLPILCERKYWNFYEWSKGLTGSLIREDEPGYEAGINCLFVLALRAFHQLEKMLQIPESYPGLDEKVCVQIRDKFWDAENSMFMNKTTDDSKSELIQALAILCDVTTKEESERLAEQLVSADTSLTPVTLSMIGFKYDALLKVNQSKYKSYVLKNISDKYEKMLDAGATSFWETEDGERAFRQAGSLCHGWSAMPVYYYHKLLK